MNKIELKKQLEKMGIKVAGNYVRRKDLEKKLTEIDANYTIVDSKAASKCVEYILDTEADDYEQHVKDNRLTEENWDSLDHVYVFALKAIGEKPDSEFFK